MMYRLSRIWNRFICNIVRFILKYCIWDITKRNKDIINYSISSLRDIKDILGHKPIGRFDKIN